MTSIYPTFCLSNMAMVPQSHQLQQQQQQAAQQILLPQQLELIQQLQQQQQAVQQPARAQGRWQVPQYPMLCVVPTLQQQFQQQQQQQQPQQQPQLPLHTSSSFFQPQQQSPPPLTLPTTASVSLKPTASDEEQLRTSSGSSAAGSMEPKSGGMGKTRPCAHNSWDNVRVVRKKMTLRCRTCQQQWLANVEDVWRNLKCELYNEHKCRAGANCDKLHIHSRKQGLKERLNSHGLGLLKPANLTPQQAIILQELVAEQAMGTRRRGRKRMPQTSAEAADAVMQAAANLTKLAVQNKDKEKKKKGRKGDSPDAANSSATSLGSAATLSCPVLPYKDAAADELQLPPPLPHDNAEEEEEEEEEEVAAFSASQLTRILNNLSLTEEDEVDMPPLE